MILILISHTTKDLIIPNCQPRTAKLTFFEALTITRKILQSLEQNSVRKDDEQATAIPVDARLQPASLSTWMRGLEGSQIWASDQLQEECDAIITALIHLEPQITVVRRIITLYTDKTPKLFENLPSTYCHISKPVGQTSHPFVLGWLKRAFWHTGKDARELFSDEVKRQRFAGGNFID